MCVCVFIVKKTDFVQQKRIKNQKTDFYHFTLFCELKKKQESKSSRFFTEPCDWFSGNHVTSLELRVVLSCICGAEIQFFNEVGCDWPVVPLQTGTEGLAVV